MNNLTENEDKIKEYLMNNYEHIVKELTPIIIQRDGLLESQQHHVLEIKDQFRHACGSIIISMINKDNPDISLEDVIIYIRSLNIDHFINLNIKELTSESN